MSTFTPSKYQAAVFDFISKGQGHGRVNALAGSGKTTTAKKALNLIPMSESVLFVAFNKTIADELKKDIPFNVEAMTLHSFGFKALNQIIKRPRVDKWKVGNILQQDFDMNDRKDRGRFYGMRNTVTKLVGLYKNSLIFDPTMAEAEKLCAKHELEWDIEAAQKSIYVFHESNKITSIIDFDDMIFLPILREAKLETFDWVFVDEFQDLNEAQMELVIGAGKGGRMIVIGDPRQSIYGFRGACVSAMDDFTKRVGAVELPLSICYRCSQAVIREAQKIVPEIEWAEGAPEGVVADVKNLDKVSDGDFVLCRVTAPLVSTCLRFIREGRKAIVRGRDIGEGLVSLAEKINEMGSGNDWLFKMERHRGQELEKASRKQNSEDEIIAINDRYDTLAAIYQGVERPEQSRPDWTPSVAAIVSKIQQIFSDDIRGIVFSTVHKAKGLETDKVFILMPSLLPHPRAKQPWMIEQEKNLKYVAVTRAKKELYYVQE